MLDSVIHSDILTLFGFDYSVNSQSKVEGATGHTAGFRLYIRGDTGNNGKCWRGVWWGFR